MPSLRRDIPAILLALAGACLCTVRAIPVDPNATQGLLQPENITLVGKVTISVPAEVLPARDLAFARIHGKAPAGGVIQAVVESSMNILPSIKGILEQMMESVTIRLQPEPALKLR